MTNDKKDLYMVYLNGLTHFICATKLEMLEWCGQIKHDENSLTVSKINVVTFEELDNLFIL